MDSAEAALIAESMGWALRQNSPYQYTALIPRSTPMDRVRTAYFGHDEEWHLTSAGAFECILQTPDLEVVHAAMGNKQFLCKAPLYDFWMYDNNLHEMVAQAQLAMLVKIRSE